MSQTTKLKQVPLDILHVDSFLQDFRADLTDVMMMAVDEWSAALRDDIRSWQESGGPEPGWQSFRDWMNDICREDTTPSLKASACVIPMSIPTARPMCCSGSGSGNSTCRQTYQPDGLRNKMMFLIFPFGNAQRLTSLYKHLRQRIGDNYARIQKGIQ